MKIELIIIGDEILSGRRQDVHLQHSISLLAPLGHELIASHTIGDTPRQIVQCIQQTINNESDVVFCFGGIGATPDDHTRACAAQAFEQALVRHPEAAREIEGKFGEAAYPHRIHMADLPQQATLIPNPYNRVPGFSLGDHHFLPGFPQMAGPMMSWVLENRYRASPVKQEIALRIVSGHESDYIETMKRLIAKFPDIKLASLPVIKERERYVDFVLKGQDPQLSAARQEMIVAIQANGDQWEQMYDGKM